MNIESFSLHFCHLDVDYDLELKQGVSSDYSITIDGVNYSVLGREDLIEAACQILSSLHLETVKSQSDLRDRLSNLTGKKVDVEIKANGHGQVEQFFTSHEALLKDAYSSFIEELNRYAAKNLKEGELLVDFIGVSDSKPHSFGRGFIEQPSPSTTTIDQGEESVSGGELWAILLTDVLETKYGKKIQVGEKIKHVANNQLMFIYPIEKEYKKVLAAELIERGELNEDQLLRAISDKVEPIRARLNDKIAHTEQQLKIVQAESEGLEEKGFEGSVKASLDSQKDAHLERLNLLKELVEKLPSTIPDEFLDVSLKELLEEKSIYMGRVYTYDLLDQFLMKFDQEKLLTSNLHRIEYADIMRKELLEPLGLCHQGNQTNQAQENGGAVSGQEGKIDASSPVIQEATRGPSGAHQEIPLPDLLRLLRALVDPRGLVGADNKTILLTNNQLRTLFLSLTHQVKRNGTSEREDHKEKVVEMGGMIDQSRYSLWIDSESGVGVVAICHGSEMPFAILNAFKNEIQRISHGKK